jgi:DNA helicase MCM9
MFEGPEKTAESGEACFSEYVFAFSSFLSANYAGEIERILAQADSSKYAAVRVNFLDLACFHSDLAARVLAQPKTFLPVLDEALRDAQTRFLTEAEHLLESNSRHQLFTFKPLVHVRISNLPQCTEVTKPTISGLRSGDIGRLIVLCGTVTRTGSVMVREKERDYECLKCGHQFRVQATPVQKSVAFELPLRCPSGNELRVSANGEGTFPDIRRWKRSKRSTAPCSGTRFIPVSRQTADSDARPCGDYQEIRLQESVQHLGMGTIPRSILVILTDDLADSCKAGDELTVCGILQRRWLRPLTPDARCDIDIILEAVHVQVNNERKAVVVLSAELTDAFAQYWRLAKRDGCLLRARDRIVRALCPQTYGMYIVKLVMLLSLIGGVPQTDSNGARVRGESHLLLVGDPGTAKSRLLRYAALLSPRAVLTTGIGTSGAGLTVTAVREAATGEWALEAGALVLADGGLCCIDEFDSIREHDRAAIHEAMEQQTVSVAKAGLVCRLNTRTTVFAATNPKASKILPQSHRLAGDMGNQLSITLGVASPLLSRFDVILMLTDKQDDRWDEQVADFVLNDYAAVSGSASETDSRFFETANDVLDDAGLKLEWNTDQLRQYLHHVRVSFRPRLSPASERVLGAYYSMQRSNSERSVARTTVRLLESLVRLTQAHARLMYRWQALVQDAIFAIAAVDQDFVKHAMTGHGDARQSEFPLDPDEGYREYAALVLKKLGIESEAHPEDGLAMSHHAVACLSIATERSIQELGKHAANEKCNEADDIRISESDEPNEIPASPQRNSERTQALMSGGQPNGKASVENALEDFDFSAIEGRFLADASLGSWAASLEPS